MASKRKFHVYCLFIGEILYVNSGNRIPCILSFVNLHFLLSIRPFNFFIFKITGFSECKYIYLGY